MEYTSFFFCKFLHSCLERCTDATFRSSYLFQHQPQQPSLTPQNDTFARHLDSLCHNFLNQIAHWILLSANTIYLDLSVLNMPQESENNETAISNRFHTIQFWGTLVALCLLAFISTLDVAIISTSLPAITSNIGGASQYVWIANSFLVASSVLQPLFGQLATIFGRRMPLSLCVGLFALGSGIGGGASSVAMLIVGRTIQGVGAGGIYVLIDVVCCDLVPLRERGKYLGLMFSWAGLAAALGPPVGGLLAEKASWRWIFWINLPVCGLALIVLLVFMRVKSGNISKQQDTLSKLKQLDYVGNLIFIPSMVAILWGLIFGGNRYPWHSFRIVVPLVLGITGWSLFHIQQHFAKNQSVPSRLFANRTSIIAFFLTFTSSILVQSLTYFLPIYFQGVLGTTVLHSGTFFLPYAIGSLLSAVLGGALLSKYGSYKMLHAAAFSISAIAFGLLTLLNNRASKVAWVFIQLIAAAGTGVTMSVMLPAIMAGLPESDVASSSATYSFIRNFGLLWGITISGIIFNSVINRNLNLISDPSLRSDLAREAAYSFASRMHSLRKSLEPAIWNEVTEVYTRGLRAIWWFGVGISIVSLFVVFGEKSLVLRKELDTEYGLEGAKVEKKPHLDNCQLRRSNKTRYSTVNDNHRKAYSTQSSPIIIGSLSIQEFKVDSLVPSVFVIIIPTKGISGLLAVTIIHDYRKREHLNYGIFVYQMLPTYETSYK